VNVSEAGLYLWARPLLSRHQPILIPWSEVKQAQETILYWRRAMRLSIGMPEVATATLPWTFSLSCRPIWGTILRRVRCKGEERVL